MRASSLTQGLVDRLAARIANGKYGRGEKLPSESVLMAEEGVSRTVVREALSRLHARGLVETRHGVGSFVLGRGEGPVPLDAKAALTLEDVIRLLEFRIGIEIEAAGLAAQRRTRPQLAQLAELMDALVRAEARPEEASTDEDFAFHLKVAECSANRYFSDALNHLGRWMIPRSRVDSSHGLGGDRRSYLERVNREHEEILGAIGRRDANAAMAAMRLHLTNSKERLRRLYERGTSPKTGADSRDNLYDIV